MKAIYLPLCLVVLIVVSACGQAPVAAPTATTTSEAAPAEPPYSEFPRAECCEGKEVAPGLYRLPRWFSPIITVEMSAGWRDVRENSVEAIYLIRGESEYTQATQVLAFFVLDADEPASQFETDLLAASQIALVGEPTQVSIAGFEAWQADFQALPNPEELGNPDADVPPGTQRISVFEDYFVTRFYFWYTFTPEAMVRVIVLDAGSQQLVFYIEAPPADFDQVASDAESILQSLLVIE
jgi:hypothetical protein